MDEDEATDEAAIVPSRALGPVGGALPDISRDYENKEKKKANKKENGW